MRSVFRFFAPIAVVSFLAAGCGPHKTSKAPVQPQRSLDELYALAAEINADAPPYLLGTGDGLGRRTFDIYVEEEVMGHPEP